MLNRAAEGAEWDAGVRRWTAAEAVLYALGVGAGAEDAVQELAFTTSDSHGIEQRVLPTFAVLLPGHDRGPDLGDYDPALVLHAEQAITVLAPIPPSGAVRGRGRVVGMYDKGADAVVTIEHECADEASGTVLVRTRTSMFVRGAGGFGGARGTSEPWSAPERAPEHVVTYRTAANQALLYRQSGDHNRLHSDPWFAGRAGFPRPILHGLCTYGYTGRALLHALCGSDPARFGSMAARFTAPVVPGAALEVEIWSEAGRHLFRTRSGGRIVLDRGVFTTRPS